MRHQDGQRKSSSQKNRVIEAKLHVPRKTLFAKAREENSETAAEAVVKRLTAQVTAYQAHLQNFLL